MAAQALSGAKLLGEVEVVKLEEVSARIWGGGRVSFNVSENVDLASRSE